MREIKFRVFDKKRCEWVHDTNHACSLFGETILLGAFLNRPDDTHVRLEELNDMVAMQFTGLLDKQGVEIYEGDIVLLKENVLRSDGKWDDGIYSIGFQDGCFVSVQMCFNEYLSCFNNDCEVIGNIYENPELLGENNE